MFNRGDSRGWSAEMVGRPVPWARWSLMICWLAIVGGFVMVAVSATATGLATWWMASPSSSSQSPMVFLPFVPPLAALGSALNASRRASLLGILAALLLGGVALGDLSTVKGYALVEGVLAAAGLIVSLATLGATFRVRE